MIDFEELKEGSLLGGAYTLEHCIQQDGAGAFFSVSSATAERLMARVLSGEAPEAEERFRAWRRALRLHHAHLIDVRDTGRTELAGRPYFYAVFEYPDEVLASALGQGPFGEPETRAVMEAVLPALSCLHEQGLVHGAVDAYHVFAVEETVKLAIDDVRESESAEARAQDMRQLGDLLRRLRAPEPLNEELVAIVDAAMAAYERPAPVPAPAVPPVERAAPLAGQPAPSGSKAPVPRWIFAGIAVLLLAILWLNWRRKPEAAPFVPAPVVVTPAPSAPVARHPATAAASRPATAGPSTWRVVAFTYRSREIAEKRAREVNSRWPELHAVVFTPTRAPGYFLVALGNRMTREEAIEVQQKARRLGLPRDSYVQNYSD